MYKIGIETTCLYLYGLGLKELTNNMYFYGIDNDPAYYKGNLKSSKSSIYAGVAFFILIFVYYIETAVLILRVRFLF